MFRKSAISLLLGAMFFTARADAQQSGARWLAFQGCWRSVNTSVMGDSVATTATSQIVCIVPGDNLNSAQLATIDSGRVVQRTQLAANGAAVPRSEGGCAGTERTSWSAQGTRVYLRVDQTCEGGNKRSASGVITVLSENGWLDVQAVTVAGQKSVRVVRYTEVSDIVGIPDEVTSTFRANAMASRAARIAASAPLNSADIIDASRNVDAATVEAWLVEAQQEISIDGKELMRLSKAGVAPSVTDLLVALAYPDVFRVDHSGQPVANAPDPTAAYGSGVMYNDYYDPFYYDPFYRYDPYFRGGRYRSSYFSPYGYRYGNRYYANYSPVIIIVRDGSTVGEPAQPHGKIVNGQGYTRGGSTSAGSGSGGSSSRTGSSGSTKSSGSGSSGSSSAGSSSSGSSGSTTTRTAKPKTIPPPIQ